MTVDLNTILWFAGFVSLTAVVCLLIYRRVWRTLPLFCIYSVWTLLGEVAAYAVHRYYPSAYLTTYFTEEGVDSVLQFAVLIELTWSILRPLRTFLLRRTILILGILIVVAAAAIWPFADSNAWTRFPLEWHLLYHFHQTVSILRILFFLLLAASSQLLSIGWRDRELQVATGLGFYSLIDVTIALMQAHQRVGPQYYLFDQIRMAAYSCSLLYWVVCFAHQEAKRREFTPQMRQMLLAVAGAARSTRAELTDSIAAKSSKSWER
jgi:hypothetical protein